jgi:hypothetical protein
MRHKLHIGETRSADRSGNSLREISVSERVRTRSGSLSIDPTGLFQRSGMDATGISPTPWAVRPPDMSRNSRDEFCVAPTKAFGAYAD